MLMVVQSHCFHERYDITKFISAYVSQATSENQFVIVLKMRKQNVEISTN